VNENNRLLANKLASITNIPKFTSKAYENLSIILVDAKLFCFKQRGLKEISLSQLFNHDSSAESKSSLRFNSTKTKLLAKSFDPNNVFIQLDNEFTIREFDAQLDTEIRQKTEFKIGDLCSFAVNNRALDHLFILKARIGGDYFVLLLGNECKRVDAELLVSVVQGKLTLFNEIKWNEIKIEDKEGMEGLIVK
jgi:hypothetical protein